MMHRSLNNRLTGFSLVETVIAVALLSILAFAVGSFGANVFYYNSVAQNGLLAQMDAREVVRQVASELREASPSALGGYPIEIASTSELVFYSDIDNDGASERVRYYLSGLTLMKDVTKPSGSPLAYTGTPTKSPVISTVRNGSTSIFSFYDTNYTGTTTPLSFPVNIVSIRLVKINLAIDRDPYRSPIPLYATTQVSVRNLKDNF